MNTIKGTDKSEALIGTPGDDTIIPGKGGDYIDGAAGTDTLKLDGSPRDYRWNESGDGSLIQYDPGDGWSDSIKNIELFEFSSRPGYLVKWDAWHRGFVPASQTAAPAKVDVSDALAKIDAARAAIAKLGGR